MRTPAAIAAIFDRRAITAACGLNLGYTGTCPLDGCAPFSVKKINMVEYGFACLLVNAILRFNAAHALLRAFRQE